jgi:hypothetical protein
MLAMEECSSRVERGEGVDTRFKKTLKLKIEIVEKASLNQ